MNYTYDDNNNLLSKLTPLGRYQYYKYDNLNRLTQITSSRLSSAEAEEGEQNFGEETIATYNYS
ncbi:MAG: RHS repeat protein [Candidatus Peribacteria bacterium]|nr:RHS repeat protein [Candidatus Peribacteria bacterium]